MAGGENINVGKAYVTIVPSLEGSQKTITEELTGVTSTASEKAGEEGGSKFGNKFASAIKGTTAVIGAAMAAATGAAVATGKAFLNAANDVSSMGDAIGDNAAKMMLDTRSYQEWDFVLQRAGSSVDAMKTSMKTLANAAAGGSEAFEALGISQEQLASMNQAELFEATVKALQNVENEQQRTALASKLLGKGALELGGIFNMTNEELDASKQKMYELGAYMDEDAISASDNYQDTMLDMQDSIKGLKIRMVKDFLPGITSVMEGLSKVFSGNGGIEEIKEGLTSVISRITSLAPQFFELASVIVESILQGFGPMLPQLVSSIFSFLTQGLLTITAMIPQLTPVIVEGIKGVTQALFTALPVLIQALLEMTQELVLWLSSGDNVKNFVDGLISLVCMLAESFADFLPVLLPALVNIIGQLADALTDPKNVNMILKSVLYIVGAVVMALVAALPEIGGVIVKTTTNIWNTLVGWGQQVGGFFSKLWNGIKEGVAKGLDNVKQKFTSIFETVKTTVKNGIDKIKSFFNFNWSLPKLKLPHFTIKGSFSLNPPKVPTFGISWYAKAMEEPMILNGATIFGAKNGQLLGGGEAGSEVIVGTNKLMEMMKDAIGINGQPITINVYGAEGQNVNDLAEVIADKLEEMTNRKGAAYA